VLPAMALLLDYAVIPRRQHGRTGIDPHILHGFVLLTIYWNRTIIGASPGS
jgi:hypothetical protein